ncbi:hypothetical protein PVMG_05803 [Plasmodium vivax Mauritania I]|uniref:Variable surface protein Vir35 n=1 Tax=Plasmodium vivax Mauritania I TaxID=1035515 RepID=A0A0J9TK85_PLAVI|nr:hypothetical protein PVMG_05803 [Plasmodium vivax Mauritania I]
MEVLKNSYFKENIKFPFFLKIYTFILLIWVYNPQNDMFIPGKSLQKRNNSDDSLYVTFNRLLAKNEIPKKLYHERTKDYTPYDIGNKGAKNNRYTKSTYANLKEREFDVLDSYKKNYKSRYSKKKGLAKLDCYYEKKIFDRIDNMYELAEKSRIARKSFIKKILIKYFIKFILFALLPFSGLLFPILCSAENGQNSIIPLSTGTCSSSGGADCAEGLIHISKQTGDVIYYSNWIISYALLIIVISVIIYTFIKVIKYEGLKAGKGKMNRKVYFNICKDVFIN